MPPVGFKSLAPMGPVCGDVTQQNDSVASLPPVFTSGRSFVDKFGAKYLYVQFDVTSAIGDAVCFDITDLDNLEGVIEVETPVTALLPYFAGIAMAAVNAGNYGFIQTFGYNQVAMTASAAGWTAGDTLKPQNGATTLVTDTAKGTNPTNVLGGAQTQATRAGAATVPAGTVFIYSMLKAAG
jgi:hypothetical protein